MHKCGFRTIVKITSSIRVLGRVVVDVGTYSPHVFTLLSHTFCVCNFSFLALSYPFVGVVSFCFLLCAGGPKCFKSILCLSGLSCGFYSEWLSNILVSCLHHGKIKSLVWRSFRPPCVCIIIRCVLIKHNIWYNYKYLIFNIMIHCMLYSSTRHITMRSVIEE